MTRGSWLLLAVVAVIVTGMGGALVGSGHGVIGAIIIIVGAPTTGLAVGSYMSRRPPLR